MKKALVLGAGGFIGSHMVKRLKTEKYWVRAADLKFPEFSDTAADEFVIGDLRDPKIVDDIMKFENKELFFDEVYQFAADMGGAGFVFTGEHDADIMHNSATINLNVLDTLRRQSSLSKNGTKVFYSSSACMYPAYNQEDPHNPDCREDSAYPAEPDSEYGWEKLFSERLFLSYNRNYGIPIAIARYHNIFGPEGTWDGGREKAPAAICRKVAAAGPNNDEIEIWGDGNQTRSFLYIDDCIDATRRLMNNSSFMGPVNIGSEEMVTINELVTITMRVANKSVSIKHVSGPTGVRGRNSNNDLIKEKLGWNSQISLADGIQSTFSWILGQMRKGSSSPFT